MLSNNISPIFLKGTGNLLAQLYIDIAERMVGDIDFILSKEDYLKGIKVLRKYGYSDVIKQKYHLPSEKHYRRIIKKQNIAAVEIHNNLLSAKYSGEFNFDKIEKDRRMINNFMVLSYEDKLNLSILSNQINDYGFYYKTISLRNAYDVFLLSKKTNAKKCPSKFKELKDPINCFLAICYLAFGEVNSLKYNKSKKTERYLSEINKLLLDDRKRKSNFKFKYIKLIIRDRLSILYKSLFQKDYRNWVINRIFEKI